MKPLFTAFYLLIIISASLAGQGLDSNISQSEPTALPRGLAPFEENLPLLQSDDPTHPPDEPCRAIAEWEENEAIIFRWGSYNSLLADIIDYVLDVTKAYIVVANQGQAESCRSYLAGQGVAPLDSIEFLYAPTNSVWIRDYAPWWLWRLESWDRAMYEWDYNRPRPQDDVIPEFLSQLWGIEYYGIDLTHTGGNWLLDSWKRAFCSQLILQENWGVGPQDVTDIFNAYCSLDTVPLTPVFYGINHLNMSAKLVNENTVLVNQYPPGSAHNWAVDQTAEMFESMTDRYGEPFRVLRVPTQDWTYTTYTYLNSLIAQNIVLVPTYNHPYDDIALDIYREIMPGYDVYGINCNGIIGAGGAINCITHNIPHPSLIQITHSRMQNTEITTQPYRIAAEILTLGDLLEDSLKICWRNNANPEWQSAPLTQTVGDSFEAYIPPCEGGNVHYYIYAKTIDGNWTTYPRYGPAAKFRFHVGPDSMTVDLIPENPPIIIPAGGGVFEYTVEIQNQGSIPEFDAWIEVETPDGNTIELVIRQWIALSQGGSIIRNLSQSVPENAEPGEYTYYFKMGDYPFSTYEEDHFTFTKLAGDNGIIAGYSDWELDGWDLPPRNTSSTYKPVPESFVELQCYPNPFNHNIMLTFDLLVEQYVSVAIFDISGREVVRLTEDKLMPGIHHLTWNAENVSSGIYFVQLKCENVISMKKIVLIK